MQHIMNLHPLPFSQIRAGKKTVELRLFDEKRQACQVGDTLLFRERGTDNTLSARIIALHPFPSFAELYRHLPLEKCGYAPEEVKNASPEDMRAYYPPEEEAKWGVLGMEFCLI